MIAHEKVPEFEYEALWAKSRSFVERSLRARDDEDEIAFHLWAAFALEMLAKSTLASIHPCLVADPSKLHSLLGACGIRRSDELRTIGAATAFERLGYIDKRFDKKNVDSAKLIAERRNAEVHSGASPAISDDAWVPSFWNIADLMLSMQTKTLEDWVGREEALRVRDVVSGRNKLHVANVRARIARRAREFALRYPQGSAERSLLADTARVAPVPRRLTVQADGFARQE